MFGLIKKAMPAHKRGFTLVELLVVIAILGIIAVGLIVAIDPIEQINRASDSSRRSLATDVMNSFNRFYASKNYSAACPDSACATYLNGLSTTTSVDVSALTTVNTNLNSAGETKSANSYTGHQQAANVKATLANTATANAATVVLCWQPKSKGQRSNANVADPNSTVFDGIGALQTALACPADNTNTCYQCVKQ